MVVFKLTRYQQVIVTLQKDLKKLSLELSFIGDSNRLMAMARFYIPVVFR